MRAKLGAVVCLLAIQLTMALRLCLALIASTLLFLNPVACSDRLPEAEGGNFVRIEAQTPEALATEEKDRALTLLRKWGLGSQRRFAEVAGVLNPSQLMKIIL